MQLSSFVQQIWLLGCRAKILKKYQNYEATQNSFLGIKMYETIKNKTRPLIFSLSSSSSDSFEMDTNIAASFTFYCEFGKKKRNLQQRQ